MVKFDVRDKFKKIIYLENPYLSQRIRLLPLEAVVLRFSQMAKPKATKLLVGKSARRGF